MPRHRRMTAATLALVFSIPASGGIHGRPPLADPHEQRLVTHIEGRTAEALALLERVVNINSGTMNFNGVREVGDVFRAELDALGFATDWIDGAPFGRAGHLVARREGSRRPRLLLIGHLDTVFELDSPFQRFERLSPTEARGPGIIDMKGGNVIIISVLHALADAGALEDADVTVVMTGDEEDMGAPVELARAALIDAAARADVALAFENGSGDPTRAVTARRGYTGWTLQVRARDAHSSQIFQEEVGAGAIYEAARVLDAFRQRLANERQLTYSPGLMLGGTAVDYDPALARGTASGKSNIIPREVVVAGDLRAISPEQLERAKQVMREAAASSLPHARSSLTFTDDYPPMAESPGNRQLLALYDRVSRDLGTGPVRATDPRDAGAADVSFAAGLVDMALDGIGLMGRHAHTPEETADLETLVTQAQRAAVLIYRLFLIP